MTAEGLVERAWLGVTVRTYASEVPTLVHNLARGRERFADSVLLDSPEGEVTYSEFAELVEGAARRLAEEGLRPGDRLAVLLRNGLDIAVAIWACARGGYVFVGLPTNLRGEQWGYMLAHSGALLALAHEEYLVELMAAGEQAGLPAGRVRLVGNHLTGAQLAWDAAAALPGAEDTYGVIYTSGTTGRPKASRLTHLGTMQAAEFYVRALGLTPADRTAIHLPFYYLSGHVTQLNPVMLAGGSAVAMPEFTPVALVSLIVESGVTFLDVVPSIWPLLLRDPRFRDVPRLRVAAFGGAPMPVSTVDRLRDRLPELELFDVYGMTETAGTITCLLDGEFASKPGSVGRPVPFNDIRLVGDDGDEVAAGEAGELWVRGPTVTAGYYNDDEATATAITDGWLHTGDYARLDEDGFVYVLDRKKDMIIHGGVKVYSVEVENLLVRHPSVAEAAVVGVPNAVAFETVAAFLVPADGAEVDVETVQGWVRTRMAAHAVPRHVRVVQTIPRNRTGKIDKRLLRELLVSELAGSRPTAVDQPVRGPSAG
ncbi:MAG: AMP-binding protein [Actinomycetota bacterium]|nr:AMP-binding protein [Actinomycetota bacterium]